MSADHLFFLFVCLFVFVCVFFYGARYINLSLCVLLNCIYDDMNQVTAKYEFLLQVK